MRLSCSRVGWPVCILFDWNRIPGNDENKLIEFIKDEFGDFDNRWIRAIKKQDENNSIFFSFRKLPDPPCVFYIKLTNDRKSATVYNYDPDDDEEQVNNNKVQKNLII